jgi:3-phosphoglycerate kinase
MPAALKSGEVLLLETYVSIVRKKQEMLLSKTISSLGDIYVNDAFELPTERMLQLPL